MSRSERVRLVTEPGPGVHVTVLDHSFTPRAEGLHRVEVDVEPGLYQLQFLKGRSIRSKLVTVEPQSGTQVVEAPDIHFKTTAPLSATKTGHELHERVAAQLSRNPRARVGRQSELFVFVRDLDRRARGSLARGLTLHRPDGELVLDLAKVAAASRPDEERPWAGATIEADPGAYRLRTAVPGVGSVEQTVWLERHWQTQVFLQRLSYKQSRVAKLSAASVLMVRRGRGFDPGRPELRLAELARQGLADQRNVLSGDDLDTLLRTKFDNPMLGIYGAHLLLLASPVDEGRLRRVLERLRQLVPGHPDVRALEVWAGDTTETFDYPPMLRSSWAIVIEASARGTAQVPAGSLAGEMADRLFGTGAWLVWRTPRQRRRQASPASPRKPGEPLDACLDRLSDALPADAESAAKLTDLEKDVVALAKDRGLASPERVGAVKALGVPLQVADEAVAGVAEKLHLDLRPPDERGRHG